MLLEQRSSTSVKPGPSDPDTPCLVYGFPANPPQPAPKVPPVRKDGPPSRGNYGSPASNQPNSAWASSPLEQRGCGWCGWLFVSLLVAGFAAGTVYCFYHCFTSEPYPQLFVSGMSLTSLGISPSSLQLNGTWHVDFSLLYKNRAGSYFACDGAAVSVYYKGAYLAGVDLHTFRLTQEHPLPLAVNMDASRRDVPGWLAHDLAEVKRIGVMELEVQFVAKHGEERDYYLCGGLSLGFSTTEEAKLIGDGLVRCPLILRRNAWRRSFG